MSFQSSLLILAQAVNFTLKLFSKWFPHLPFVGKGLLQRRGFWEEMVSRHTEDTVSANWIN